MLVPRHWNQAAKTSGQSLTASWPTPTSAVRRGGVWRFDRFARSVSHLLRALETFNALGIAFVSLCEQMDTTTPTGKMIFTVLGAVAELERSLIVERVRAGLRNARAKGKTLGRPRKIVDDAKIAALRVQGRLGLQSLLSLGIGVATLHRASVPRPKTREREFGTR